MMTQESLLARYRILRELGRGAIGTVYAARDRETGAVVALKRLDPALLSKFDADFAGRFLKQTRSAQVLKHRNIVEIHDAGEVAGTVYVAMEMLEGESLRDLLGEGPLPIARAIQIVHDIACGLEYAHLEGAVHGGLNPSNIVLLRSGVVKITDFGLGQLGEAALLSGPRADGLSYRSPEQLRDDPVDHRCDLFSLGAVFYEMLTHRPPFEGHSATDIMENILHAKPPPPSELNPHVPRALDGMVLGMLAAQAAERLPGAPIVLRDLQRLEEALGLGSGTGAGADEPTAGPPPAEPEPGPRALEPKRFRDRVPVDQSAAEEPLHRGRITDREAFDYHKAMAMMERPSGPERSSSRWPAIFAALALVLAVLGIGLTGFMYYSSGLGERVIAAIRMQEAPATAPAPPRPTAPAPVAEAAKEPAPAPVAEAAKEPATAPAAPQALPPRAAADGPAEPEPSSLSAAPAPSESASAGAALAKELPRATRPTASVPERPGGTAKLILAVSPRGEIYIDGENHGTTPPITTFDLEPGMHRIEVRNGSRKPYLTYMTVQAGDVRRIRHDFNASRAVPPPGSPSWQNGNRPVR